MIKKTLLSLLALLALSVGWFYILGKGWLGGPWSPAPVEQGPRPAQEWGADPGSSSDKSGTVPDLAESQILFGDLHNHTNYSIDAYIFNSKLVKGSGVATTADACDFARYCSALDFWSINDHAESLTPRVWEDTVASIRECNANAGDPANPDMVSFVGWEWSNGDRDDVPSHYGHKNVIFRTWEQGMTPTRPISSAERYALAKVPAVMVGLMSLVEDMQFVADMGWYFQESNSVPVCPEGVPANELPADCKEVALTPMDLYRKLDEWGFDSLVIPHGLAWGTTNPVSADFRDQLDQHEQRYQKLLEVFSGHGNSELFEDFQRIAYDDSGAPYCPEGTANFTPCCQQAGVLARRQCQDSGGADCDAAAADATARFLEIGDPAGRKIFPDASMEEWEACGQLQNSFQPSSQYVARMSGQYNLALGFDENGEPKRAKFGLIGASDGHQARPGSSYKESNRLLYTDHKDTGKGGLGADFYKRDKESGGFYYTGGLVAAHTQGRHRDAIWQALDNRNVYATSGDRMLLWFDLLNGPNGETPMGSEVVQAENPRFRVKALGALKQQPGCPEYALRALGAERVQSLCGGECYNPGDGRKAITRVEINRIQPQQRPGEKIAPLVEDSWRVFDCPADGEGCVIEFEDPDYLAGGRPALYYARVIQEEEPLIVGDPFGCEYDEEGNCIRRRYCIGDNATPDKNCLAPAEPRAWSSPIFLEHPGTIE